MLVLAAPATAANVSAAPRALQGQLWAVEVERGSLRLLGGSGLKRLAESRVNALVVRRGSLSAGQLADLRSRAAARDLPVFSPLREGRSAAAAAAACRALKLAAPGSRCAVWARSAASAAALARSRKVDVVFLRVRVGALGSLRGAGERVVGVPALRRPPGAAWREAVELARRRGSVDLGAEPQGRSGGRSLWKFAGRLARWLPPRDASPPAVPAGLVVQQRLRTGVALAWEGRAASYGVYRGGARAGKARGSSFTFSGLSCGRTYLFEVDAVDRAGNRSAKAALETSTADCSTGGPPPAPATLFVTPGGSNTSPCTRAEPCRSFNRAYQTAEPGETVEVAGGSYPSQTLDAKNGAAAPYVVIREAPGERVVVGNDGATSDCVVFEGAQYVTLQGIETTYTTVGGQRHQCGIAIGRNDAHHVTLVDVDAGMIWFGADDVTVLGGDFGPGIDENTKIEFATGHPPRNILIDGAVIHDARIDDDHQECVALWGGNGITIRNTHIYNCAVFHIWIDAEAGDTIRDVLIEGNLFTQPGPNPPSIGSTVKVGDHGGTLENIVLRGNRVLVDELFVVLGYDDGGSGDVHLFDNEVTEPITLGSGQNCMVDATYRPKPDLVYECRGNRLVAG
jgi:hypothetical protein